MPQQGQEAVDGWKDSQSDQTDEMDETRWWEAGEYLPTRSVKTQCSEERSDLNQKFVLWSAQGGSDHQGHEFQSKRGKATQNYKECLQ